MPVHALDTLDAAADKPQGAVVDKAPAAILLTFIALVLAPAPRAEVVDVLEYMLQSDGKGQSWTLGGHDTASVEDPCGAPYRAFALNKFHSNAAYEIYKVVNDEVQIRYEVYKGQWIRRFEELGRAGKAHGGVWMRRHMNTEGPGATSRAALDAYVYDLSEKAYVWSPERSAPQTAVHFTVRWADLDWRGMNETGFDLHRVLRMYSEWQDLGLIFESYDYAKGKGIVNWRWYEWFDGYVLNRPLEGDPTGRVYHCEAGHIYVADRGRESGEPVAYRYDAETGERGRRLEVVSWTSHWAPEDGPRRYVVYRDLSKEYPLEKRAESLHPTYDLPLWEGEAYRLSDLPHHYTTPYEPDAEAP
jgi:hypothetical protein